MSTYSMAEVRDQITRLPEQFAEELQTRGEIEAITVTRRGKPVLAILPWELYESIIETMEILGDEELMVALRQGMREAANGEGKPWETVKKELGW